LANGQYRICWLVDESTRNWFLGAINLGQGPNLYSFVSDCRSTVREVVSEEHSDVESSFYINNTDWWSDSGLSPILIYLLEILLR
jgi:hypothetical protein